MKRGVMDQTKYELVTTEAIGPRGRALFRVRALRNFGDVKAGDVGGFVEGTHNLSQEGECWIYDNAMAVQRAQVRDNGRLKGNSIVLLNSRVRENAEVSGACWIDMDSDIAGTSRVSGSVRVGSGVLRGHAQARGDVIIPSGVLIEGNKVVSRGIVPQGRHIGLRYRWREFVASLSR